MRIEVRYNKEASIGYGVNDIQYSVTVDEQKPFRWRSHDPPVGGYGRRDFYSNVLDFLVGLIVGKSGMRMEPEAFALAEDILKKAVKYGCEVKYVTHERGDHED